MPYTEVFEYGYHHGRQVRNFLVDVTARGYVNLSRVLDIAFDNITTHIFSREKHVTHFQTDGTFQLTLFTDQPKEMQRDLIVEPFPSPMTSQQASEFVWNWLEQVPYPPDWEHDGGSEKGWRVFNETFGLVGKNWQSLVAIRPMWIYISK